MWDWLKSEDPVTKKERLEQEEMLRLLKAREQEEKDRLLQLKKDDAIKESIAKTEEVVEEKLNFAKDKLCLDSEFNLYVYRGFDVTSEKVRFSRDYADHYDTDITSIKTVDRSSIMIEAMIAAIIADRARLIKLRKQFSQFNCKIEHMGFNGQI